MRPSLRHSSCFFAALAVLSGCSRDTAIPAGSTQAAPNPSSFEGGSPPGPAGAAASAAPQHPEPPSAPKAEPDRATVPATAQMPSPPSGPRLWSKARFAWIQPEPRPSKGWLGYLGLGSSIELRGGSLEAAKVRNSESRGGCRAWYAVEPRGYICDGDAATLDPKDAAVQAVAAEGPKVDSPWPYEYGESLGAPRYKRAPTAAEQRKTEWDLAEHLGLVAAAKSAAQGEAVDKSLIGVDLTTAADSRWGKGPDMAAWREASPLVREARKIVANGSTVAWTRQVDIDGRTFLVTHDRALVPKDRVRPYPRSEFHGVEIGAEVALPIAFFRKMDRPKYRRSADGSFEKTSESWPRLAWVALTGEEAKEGKQTFFATKEPGLWVLKDDAAVARKAEPPSVIRRMTGGRKTWLDISVLGGTLVAYEDDKPVFATMISPGRGGVPAPGRDPLDTASTPTGTFRVDGKFVTATMVSSTNDQLVHTEVQYVQNFHGPHALHAAYWHDAWGEKKSGGCVNLSPIDAKRLFEWGEPQMPKDWYGLRSLPEFGPATVVVVHK